MGFLFIARSSHCLFHYFSAFFTSFSPGFLILLYKVISVMGIMHCLFLLVWEALPRERATWGPSGLMLQLLMQQVGVRG